MDLDSKHLDEEGNLAVELVLKLTKFYQESMIEAGLTVEQIRKVTVLVAMKQIDDIKDLV